MMTKYPIGIQSFRKMREEGYLYVDKTAYLHELVSQGAFYFLSRPRRFGKSLLVSTMENYFRGNRKLFRGLAIDRLEPEEWPRYTVLHLDLSRAGYRNADDLTGFLGKAVGEWEREYTTLQPGYSPDWRFDKLIRDVYRLTGRQVVVLVDEYDSPVVDVCGDRELETANRRTLHDFYRVMKANSDCLKFVFLTGVGKLGQINIFSGLNNLLDISLDTRYAAICGITTEELTDNFREGIEELGRRRNWESEETMLKLKNQYDGYHFSEDMIDVYNPYSLVKALYHRNIGDYWFQSGTPTRLARQFLDKDWGAPDLEGYVVSQSALESGDVVGNNLALACFYTGYLTIKSCDIQDEEPEFTLGYPNAEVRNGFFRDLMTMMDGGDPTGSADFVRSLKDFIRHDDIEGFLNELKSFLAGIPYMSNTNTEPQWQKDILIISRLVGIDTDVERRTSRGRMDMVLNGTKAIYILEFKYGATPEEGLAQINEKEYALPFKNSLNHKRIIKVGVNISPETRNIDRWVISDF